MVALFNTQSATYSHLNGKVFEIVDHRDDQKTSTIIVDGKELSVSKSEITILDRAFDLEDINNILNLVEEVNEYFQETLDTDRELSLQTLNSVCEYINQGLDDDQIFSAEHIVVLLCNLEDEEVMNDILDENMEDFDPWNESIFNDSYWDMSADLNLHGEQDECDEDEEEEEEI